MAKAVPELPSVESAPWRQYADGQTWKIDTTTDLDPPSTPSKARQAAYAWARRNGFQGTFRTEGDRTLYMRFVPNDEAGAEQ